MSKASRKLPVGATVITDFSGRITQHTITEIKEGTCQSGILFRVTPCVRGSGGVREWLDADWFFTLPELHAVNDKLRKAKQ